MSTTNKTKKSPRRRRQEHRNWHPEPLPMPAFGTPANGRQCQKCRRWFHRRVFWRQTSRSGAQPAGYFVLRCPRCIEAMGYRDPGRGRR